jgi:hypothetical protein
MAKRTITLRTAERLSRAAYEFEFLASRLDAEGFKDYASGVRAVSSRLGDMGRSLSEKLSS